MIKRKVILLSIIIGIGIVSLTGCGRYFVPELSEEIKEEEKTEQDESENENEEDAMPQEAEIPQLPDTGKDYHDFVPESWWVYDYEQLDFNEDGILDYVGVLQNVESHRILFAIASDGADGYCLDFQDNNLIRDDVEGGVNHQGWRHILTAEGTSFTTHATYSDGDSEWRWLEEYTYTYREGVWWLTLSETTYGYTYRPNNIYATSYYRDDWESGVGIRKRRSSEPDDMKGKGNSAGYDVVYELSLDEPLTLEQAGMRAREASNEEAASDGMKIYKEKIYYSSEIVEGTDTVELRLNRMEPDGTGKETIFEYRYPEGYVGNDIPYPKLDYEISGDEIVVEVSVKGEPHQFYRMNTDGSGLKNIGQMPKELEIPEEENGVMELYDDGGRITIPEGVMTAQVSPQDILKGNPVIYDRFRIDGWVFEWLISDYYDDVNWFLEDGVLVVSREGNTEDTQIIKVEAEGGYGRWISVENKFEYVDVNFDNIPDLLICTGQHGNQGLLTYYCFLQTENGFVEAPTFTYISNPAIDADNKLILSQWRNWAASHSWAEYKCKDNEYVMYRELCEEPDKDHRGDEEVWVWTVNGEEIGRSDKLSAEEIDDLLYNENSEWQLSGDRWRTLYNDGLTTDYSIYDEP